MTFSTVTSMVDEVVWLWVFIDGIDSAHLHSNGDESCLAENSLISSHRYPWVTASCKPSTPFSLPLARRLSVPEEVSSAGAQPTTHPESQDPVRSSQTPAERFAPNHARSPPSEQEFSRSLRASDSLPNVSLGAILF